MRFLNINCKKTTGPILFSNELVLVFIATNQNIKCQNAPFKTVIAIVGKRRDVDSQTNKPTNKETEPSTILYETYVS